jgi:hypothetical protein
MKAVLAVLSTIAVAAYLILGGDSKSDLFESWKMQQGLTFAPEEEAFRRGLFLETLAAIKLHNSLPGETYKMGLNQFSAMTADEFRQGYLGYLATQEVPEVDEEYTVTADVDWSAKGYVTGVKNQGQCGSCWSFSATGALEALAMAKTGSLPSFSEQQLVDCSRSYGNMGCNGGLMDSAFKYVKDHGITTESAYPYTAKDGTCKTFTPAFKNTGFVDVRGCSSLATALEGRPISIAVDANNWSRYSSGVFSNCGTKLDHGVLLVGVSDSWKVKNSWGSGWGERGFIRLAQGNTCGLCNQPSYPN